MIKSTVNKLDEIANTAPLIEPVRVTAQHWVDAIFLSNSSFFLDIQNHSTILVVYKRPKAGRFV